MEKNNIPDLMNAAAGYFFQVKVADTIKELADQNKHQWKNQWTEHRWVNPITREEGFVDIILSDDANQYMIIECKRVEKDGTYLFLVPSRTKESPFAELLWSYYHPKTGRSERIIDWSTILVEPNTLSSELCVIRQSDCKNEKPILERYLSNLLLASEAFAAQCYNLLLDGEHDSGSIFIPCLITNATLLIYRYDTKNIDISTGMIFDQKNIEVNEVPFIQFNKTLSTTIEPNERLEDIKKWNSRCRRSTFIVNYKGISDFMRSFKCWEHQDYPYPFMKVRKSMNTP